MNDFLGLGCATLIGSMPQKDRASTIDLVLQTAPEVPSWPQLTVNPAERMMEQYIEGLPGLVSTGDREFVNSVSSEFDREVLLFYEQFLAVEDGGLKVDDSLFRMGEETGVTFRAFMETIKKVPTRRSRRKRPGNRALYPSLRHEGPGRPRAYL